MKTYLTSDLHFGHKNIFNFCPDTRSRYKNDGVEDLDYMAESMISEWNDTVEQNDLVYILGDIAFLPSQSAIKIMRRLNGKKILIAGNHDKKTIKDPVFRSCFESIHDYLEVNYDGTKIVMCHYPIYDHNGAGRGSLMLHGHRHGKPHNIEGKIMDVGYDATGEIVMDIERIINKLSHVPHMYHNDPR
jgi:calcineurin-like phosphoesterase family protein